jgi:cobalt-zinc-cadmium efflux system membrane fusion protein
MRFLLSGVNVHVLLPVAALLLALSGQNGFAVLAAEPKDAAAQGQASPGGKGGHEGHDHATEGKAEARKPDADAEHAGHDHAKKEPEGKDEHKDEEPHEDHADEKGSDEDHGDEGGKDEHGHDEASAARLSVDKLSHAGVTFAPAESGHVDDGVQLLGTVRPDGDRLAHITARFPGIVREVRASVGDSVRAGDILAIVESSESLAPYELKTLIGGTIIEKHLTRGEAVDRERQAFIVADLSNVWVQLSIYQNDLERVSVGDRVHVRAGQEEAVAEGVITYITPGVDDKTRTATARVTLPNPDRRWRPGMFVVAYVLTPHPSEVIVPTSAIQQIEGKSVVFVAEDDEVEPRTVTLGHRGETVVEVLTGLRAGERVASTNTFLLKAELGKSEAEHEH